MPKPPAHYALLGVPPAADARALRTAYIALAKLYAPRREGDYEVRFRDIALAYGVLKNKEFRARYDQELRLRGLNCGACAGRGTTYRSRGFTQREEVACKVCRGTGRNDL